MTYGEKTLDLLAHEARREHGELHELLSATRSKFAECILAPAEEKTGCIVKTLDKLRGHVAEHFAREEAGGWLEEAIIRAPHLAHAATELEHEHKPLLERADRLLLNARGMSLQSEELERVRAEYEEFTAALLHHEAREERLLEKGFNEDLGLNG